MLRPCALALLAGHPSSGGSSPRATPAPPRPQPRPAPPVVAARPVSVPSPDELGIRLDPEPQAVTVPGPDELGINPD